MIFNNNSGILIIALNALQSLHYENGDVQPSNFYDEYERGTISEMLRLMAFVWRIYPLESYIRRDTSPSYDMTIDNEILINFYIDAHEAETIAASPATYWGVSGGLASVITAQITKVNNLLAASYMQDIRT